MSFLFGGERPSASNTIRYYEREINKHIRSMERDNDKTLREERKLISEIKAHAVKNDMDMAKLKSKELVRSRIFRKRLCVTQQGLISLKQQLSIIQTSQHSQEILAKTTRILQALNSKMDLGSTYKMLTEFEQQSTVLDEKQEILNDTMDNMFELDSNEVDATLSSVFEELGLETLAKMNSNKVVTNATKTESLEEQYARLKETSGRQ